MTGLYHIITYYVTIMSYYFSYYFPIMSHGTIIFFIIFPIMTHYFSLFFLLFSIMTGCWHLENGKGQTAVLDQSMEEWLDRVYEECQLICIDRKAHIQNGKLPEGVFLYYYTHYFFLLYALFDLADHDCGRCKCVLGTAFLCTLLLCVATIIGHWGSCQCCLKCPNSSAHMLLFCILSLLLQLFFQLYALFQNKK